MNRRTLLLASLASVTACLGSPDDSEADTDLLSSAAIPRLPEAGGALPPWGGADVSRWSGEAILANAVSRELNLAFAQRGTRDATVAVALRVVPSDYRPFSDGQTNARASLAAWTQPRPPVLATLIRTAGGASHVTFRFDRALPYDGTRFVLRVGATERAFEAPRDPSGDRVGSLPLSAAPGVEGAALDPVVFVKPAGWSDWFPLHFRMPVRDARAMVATLAPAQRAFGGRTLPDPLRVSVQREASPATTPYARLRAMPPAAGYNAAPYRADSVHGQYPTHSGLQRTAVGGAWTWLTDAPAAPMKLIYNCFDRRDAAAEEGVPSGAGWHRIGDPAETLANTLEGAPILVGYATGSPAAPPSGAASYGLGDVATFRWLRPGEALLTTRGGDDAHANYHWFAVHHDREVCAEVWVHPCVPRAGVPGFACN